jgi:hypothetical protein
MITPSEIVREYTKCVMDPIYAIETYFKTYDKTRKGYVRFKLFPKQRDIIDGLTNHRFNVVTKPRQAGVSTTAAAYFAIKLGFADPNFPQHILTIANNKDMSQEFLVKVKGFLEQIPRWVWGEEYYGSKKAEEKNIFTYDSKGYIELPNGSSAKAVSSSKTAARGYAPTYLVFDEAAFIEDGAEVYGAAITSLGSGGGALLISTPNGQDSLYYKTYEMAKTKRKQDGNGYNVIEMKWYQDCRYNKSLRWEKDDEVIQCEDIDVYTRAWTCEGKDYKVTIAGEYELFEEMIDMGWKPNAPWYQDMCMGMNNDKRMIAQELDVSFIGSGGSVIDHEFIEFQEKENVKDPVWTSGDENEFWIWEKPIEGHQYMMGVDVSRGDSADLSTITIIDFTTMTQVMEYQGLIQPDLLAEIVYEYGNLYKSLTVVDITGGMGVSTVLKLLELDYKYLHYEETRGKVLKTQEDLQKYAKNSGKKMPGLSFNGIRTTMIAHFEMSVRLGIIKVRSRRCTSEMRTFVYKGKTGRPDHQDGYHDDLIMCMAMALWVLEHSFKNLEKLESQNKAMLAAWSVGGAASKKDEYNTGFTPKGARGTSTGKPKFSETVSKGMQDPKGDYLWLFSGMK